MARTRNQAVKETETPATHATIENSGLCGTCESAVFCMYLGDAEHPVLECEEFTHHRAGAAKQPRRRMSLAAVPKPDPSGEKLPLSMGLCSDCEHRSGCTFDKPEGGVWQCEEYC